MISNPTSGNLSKRIQNKTSKKRYPHTHAHHSIIHHSQGWKQLKSPWTDERMRKTQDRPRVEYYSAFTKKGTPPQATARMNLKTVPSETRQAQEGKSCLFPLPWGVQSSPRNRKWKGGCQGPRGGERGRGAVVSPIQSFHSARWKSPRAHRCTTVLCP